MCMNHPESFRGYLLIAPPKIGDKRFANTVILVVNHSSVGAWGVVVNKPIANITVKHVFEKAGVSNTLGGVIHAGGPVNNQTVHLLHTSEVAGGETIYITDEVSMSNDMDFIVQMSRGIMPNKFKAFLGACSWGPGQLEGEIRGESPWTSKHSWLYMPADADLIFDLTGIEQWQEAVQRTAKTAVRDWMV